MPGSPGTIAALKPVGYEIFNLGGGGTPVSLNTVISMLEERLGKQAVIQHKTFHKADIKTTSADISKAHTMLGWTPKVELDEGIDASVAWYRDNQPWSSELMLP